MKHNVIYVATHPSLIRNVLFLSFINKEIQTSQRSEIKCYFTGHLGHIYILYVRTVRTYIYLLYLEVIITAREGNIFTEQRMLHLKIMSSDISAMLKYKKHTHIPRVSFISC